MAKPNPNSLGLAALIAASVAFLPGCDFLGGLTLMTCGFSSDKAHCYQDAAVQSGNPADCDKIPQKDEFKKAGSNPPQDKCRMMIAANKEDPSVCNTLKGGLMSYTKEDCQTTVAQTATKPDTCTQMQGTAAGTCADNVAGQAVADVQALANKPDKTDAEIQELQKKMADLNSLNGMMSSAMKSQVDASKGLIGNMR